MHIKFWIMRKKVHIILGVLFAAAMICQANIFETLKSAPDSNDGTVIIHQDSRIESLIYKKREYDLKTKPTTTVSGYRVQVYSSNDQRTGKVAAYKIEEKIRAKFPNYGVYVSYISPFWKVRVGDCKTTAEAQALREELKKSFSELQQETYIVKDQVLIPEF